jgi:hypothetical protein
LSSVKAHGRAAATRAASRAGAGISSGPNRSAGQTGPGISPGPNKRPDHLIFTPTNDPPLPSMVNRGQYNPELGTYENFPIRIVPTPTPTPAPTPRPMPPPDMMDYPPDTRFAPSGEAM